MTWTLLAIGTALRRGAAAGAAVAGASARHAAAPPVTAPAKTSTVVAARLPRRAPRFARPVERAAPPSLLAVAVVVWAVTRTYPNYDSYYHLVWGRELLARHARRASRPTPRPPQHPL